MSLLRKSDKLSSLRKKSADALGIFQTTVSNLQDTNKTIDSEKEVRSQEIQKLRDEHIELTRMESRNKSIMDKINDFLGDLS
jgi:hypothetical protein